VAEIEEAVYSRLTTTAAVTAICSTRIYPNKIPQEATLPAVAYQRVSTRRVKAHAAPTGLARVRVQVTCVASSYSAVKALATAVRKAMEGVMGTVGGVGVQGSWLETDADEYGDAETLHSVRQDFMIWHTEAIT
jgi:hypothetical protein